MSNPEEILEILNSSRGGYSKEKLSKMGVSWPPRKGWKKQLLRAVSSVMSAPSVSIIPETFIPTQSTWGEKHDAYLKSEHWLKLKVKVVRRAGRACESCGIKRDLQGHHIRYREPLESCTEEDVMALCKRCHKAWHKHLKANGLTLSQFDRESTVSILRTIRRYKPRRKRSNCEAGNAVEVELECLSPKDRLKNIERIIMENAETLRALRAQIEALEAALTPVNANP